MRIIREIPVCIIFFLVAATTIHAQEETVVVKRSDNKIILEGKIYYIHIVKPGETLYSISRAYNVSEKVIVLENPDVFAGLKESMALKIPAEPVIRETEEIKLESDEFIYHVIKEGETLYSLSRKYNIDVGEIEKNNPEVKYSDLQINQVIKIPKIKQVPPEQGFQDNNFVYHLVKKGETLFSLSRQYEVSIEEIKELNPQLRWGELKFDEYVKIPVISEDERVADSIYFQPAPDTLAMDSLRVLYRWDWLGILEDTSLFEPPGEKVTIGLFLPLLLNWYEMMNQPADSVMLAEEEFPEGSEEEEETRPEDLINPMTMGFLEFYEGLLLAVDSLKNAGFSVTLKVYDTEKNPDILSEMLTDSLLDELDMIIGPADARNVALLSEQSKMRNIPMISPFQASDKLVYDNPYLVQLPPSYQVEMRYFAEYISDYYDRTLVFIHSGDSTDRKRTGKLKNEILERIAEKTIIEEVLFKELVFNDSLPSDFNHTLTKDTENIIIIPSAREAVVSNILTGLYFLLDEYRIKVFGMSNWPRFRSIDLEYYHNLQLHYFSSFYIDYDKKQVVDFIRKFRETYETEPYRITSRGYNLSMLGFDLMMYFVPVLQEYGKNLIFHLDQPGGYPPMLGSYEFGQLHPFSGRVNQHTILVRYRNDLTIEYFIPEF